MPEATSFGSVADPASSAGRRQRPHERSRTGCKKGHKKDRKKGRKPKYYGVIDLGTNNCRLLIARSLPDGFQVVDSYSKVVRLGAGLARTGRMADANMDAAVEAIKICADKMKDKSVQRWRCIATQACRQAENGDIFLSRVKRETGLAFETISPRVEARLSVMGCLNLLDPDKDVALVIDIGGGSTELAWVDIRRFNRTDESQRMHRPPISAWVSLPVGVVSLSELYPEDPEAGEAARTAWYEDMKNHVRIFQNFPGRPWAFGWHIWHDYQSGQRPPTNAVLSAQ